MGGRSSGRNTKFGEHKMRFGIFSIVDHYPAELARSTQQFYEELLEQIEVAESLGFDSFWVAEHHFHEYGAIPRPPIWLAAAAKRTKRIKLGSAVVVLPFDNPLRVAEDYAMVDIISAGRLILGVGSGYLKHEYEGFGINPEEKRERFDEALEIILKGWSGERFSYAGRFNNINNVKLNTVPLQRPYPPVAIAILRNEAARHVGLRGMPVMLIPYATTEKIEELAQTVSVYKESFSESKSSGVANGVANTPRAIFALHTHCAETTSKAVGEAREPMDRYVRTRLYAKQRSLELLDEKKLIAVGDSQKVIEVLKVYERAGMTDYLAISNFGGMPHEQVISSLRVLAKDVMPSFEKIGPTVL